MYTILKGKLMIVIDNFISDDRTLPTAKCFINYELRIANYELDP